MTVKSLDNTGQTQVLGNQLPKLYDDAVHEFQKASNCQLQ